MNTVSFNTIKEAKYKIIELEKKIALEELLNNNVQEKNKILNHLKDKINEKLIDNNFKKSKIQSIEILDGFFVISEPFQDNMSSFKVDINYKNYICFIPTKININTEEKSTTLNIDNLNKLKNIDGLNKDIFVKKFVNFFNIKRSIYMFNYTSLNNLIINYIKDSIISKELYDSEEQLILNENLKLFRKNRFKKEHYNKIKFLFAYYFKKYYFKEILNNDSKNFIFGEPKYKYESNYIDYLIYNLLRNKNLFYGLESIKTQTLEQMHFMNKNILDLFKLFEEGEYFLDFLLCELTNKNDNFGFLYIIK